MGLDHPLVQEELGRWRSLSPDELGISVAGEQGDTILLSLWMVETSTSKGERHVFIQPVAVKRDGTRVPSVERTADGSFHKSPANPRISTEDRLMIFAKIVEPTLQRELKHKGAASGDGGYSAELIGYIELS